MAPKGDQTPTSLYQFLQGVAMPISHEELKRLLHYDPETGVWTRLIQTNSRCWIGKRADTPYNSNYRRISIDGVYFAAHRLAWFYVTGCWPSALIDHKDRDGQNNRWENLREATKALNAANAKLRRENTSGLKGVSWGKRDGKWRAYISSGGKFFSLGQFDCPAAAHFSYLVEADKHFGKFARAR